MPRGLFLRGGEPAQPGPRSGADTFITYGEFLRQKGLRRGTTPLTPRQKAARRRAISPRGVNMLVGRTRKGAGIEAKHFLENAWDEIVGANGEKAFREHVQIVRKVFQDFRRG
jgi:hypothetical protein